MRFFAIFAFLAVFIGLGAYVVWHNNSMEQAAAANDGALCTIEVLLDEELYGVYTQGGLDKALTGNLTTTVDGNSVTTDSSVTTELPGLLLDVRQKIAEMSLIAGTNCSYAVSKFPALTPGRVQVGVHYFRSQPEVQP